MSFGLELSIIDDESVSDIADSVAEEVATCRAVGYSAAVIEIIGASATVAFSIAARLQHQVLRNIVVLIAVGAGEVEADDTHKVLTHLGNGELAHNESAQAKIRNAVTGNGGNVDR